MRFVTASKTHIFQRLVVDTKKAAGRAIFRGHVGQRRTVGKAQAIEAGAIIFHKPPNNALGAQHLRGGEHQIGGGDALRHCARQFEADDFGDQHRHRLPQHRSLGLDPANAPTKHAKAVYHRRMAVCTHAGVGIRDLCSVGRIRCPYRLRNMFQIHLMANASAGRDSLEIIKALAAPFQEVIAFAVAVIFDFHILLCCLGMAKLINHYRVVDDQMHGNQRIDFCRITAQFCHRIAHRGKINDARNACEILQQNARWTILNFLGGFGIGLPIDNRLRIGHIHRKAAIFETQHIFEEHFHRKRQARYITQFGRCLGQRIISNGASAGC